MHPIWLSSSNQQLLNGWKFSSSSKSKDRLTCCASRKSLYLMRARGMWTFAYSESLADGVILKTEYYKLDFLQLISLFYNNTWEHVLCSLWWVTFTQCIVKQICKRWNSESGMIRGNKYICFTWKTYIFKWKPHPYHWYVTSLLWNHFYILTPVLWSHTDKNR